MSNHEQMQNRPPSQEEEEEQSQAVQVEAEIVDLRAKLLRLQADFENYRRRMGRARSDTVDECRSECVAKLLPIYDNLRRALNHAQETPEILAFLSGFEMIRQQFAELFQQMGVEEIAASPGEAFDPKVHEASGMAPLRDNAQEGTIAAELEKGYAFKGALIRPARVLVFAEQ